MLGTEKCVRVSPLLDYAPRDQHREQFVIRMLQQCIDDNIPLYVKVAAGSVAYTNRLQGHAPTTHPIEHPITIQMLRDPIRRLRLDPQLRFLALDTGAIEDLITSKSHALSIFSSGGLFMPLQKKRGGEVSLMRTHFSIGLLQLDNGINIASSKAIYLNKSSSEVSSIGNIKVGDVYIEDALSHRVVMGMEGLEKISCPHKNLKEKFPHIFWMYMGARSINGIKSATHEEAVDWLKKNAPRTLFTAKQIRNTAANFTQRDLDRSKGRGKEKGKKFKVEELNNNAFKKNYKEVSIGSGLALLIYAADKWADSKNDGSEDGRVGVAIYLSKLGFYDGQEIEDLTSFIVGPKQRKPKKEK